MTVDQKVEAGNPYWRERLSTVDLLVLTSLYQLILILKILNIFYKQDTLTRRSIYRSVSIPWLRDTCINIFKCLWIRYSRTIHFWTIVTRWFDFWPILGAPDVLRIFLIPA